MGLCLVPQQIWRDGGSGVFEKSTRATGPKKWDVQAWQVTKTPLRPEGRNACANVSIHNCGEDASIQMGFLAVEINLYLN